MIVVVVRPPTFDARCSCYYRNTAALNISGFVLLLPDFLLLLLLLLDAKIRAKLRLPRGMEILFIYMSRSDF